MAEEHDAKNWWCFKHFDSLGQPFSFYLHIDAANYDLKRALQDLGR